MCICQSKTGALLKKMADIKNGGNLAPSQPTTYPRYREGYGTAFSIKQRENDFSKNVAKCLLLFAKCSSLRNTCHVLKNALECLSKFEKCFRVRCGMWWSAKNRESFSSSYFFLHLFSFLSTFFLPIFFLGVQSSKTKTNSFLRKCKARKHF